MIFPFGVLAWVMSWRNLARRKEAEREDTGYSAIDDLPKATYIMPFAYFSSNRVATGVMLIVATGVMLLING